MRTLLAACLVFLVGCSSTPGFRAGWEVYLPPALKTATVLSPMPASQTTVYSAEVNSGMPVSTRQFYTVPYPAMPAPAPAPVDNPRRQLLPMPKETPPGTASPGCNSACPE